MEIAPTLFEMVIFLINLIITGMNDNLEMDKTPVRDIFAWFKVGKCTSSLYL